MAGSNSMAANFDFELYRYTPSLPAAIVAVIIFTILTACHVYKLIKHRTSYFTAFTTGGLFQMIGYGGRIVSHFSTASVPAYSVQAIFILVAPALYAASVYMILGRVIRVLQANRLSVVPVRYLTKIFVTGDVVSFALQAAGGGIQAGGTLDLYNLGEKIIVIGLLGQIVMFGFFVVTSMEFHRRICKRPTQTSVGGTISWPRHLMVLYMVSGVILVRSIFRVIEYLGGNDGYLISHEVFLYVFDAFLMAGVMIVFLVYYVDDLGVVRRKEREELSSSDGRMEMNGMGG